MSKTVEQKVMEMRARGECEFTQYGKTWEIRVYPSDEKIALSASQPGRLDEAVEKYTPAEFAAFTCGDFRRAFARLRMRSTLFTRRRRQAGGDQMTVVLQKEGFLLSRIVAGESESVVETEEELIPLTEPLVLLRRLEEWLDGGHKLRLLGFTPGADRDKS